MRTLALLFLACTPAFAQSPASTQTPDIEHGRRLFVADGCYGCHGTVGQGGVGIRLAPNPPPVSIIAAYLRNPLGEMPPYGSRVVSDADVRDIHAYLASIPKPPAASTIAELN